VNRQTSPKWINFRGLSTQVARYFAISTCLPLTKGSPGRQRLQWLNRMIGYDE
jgi:hypothetical protein